MIFLVVFTGDRGVARHANVAARHLLGAAGADLDRLRGGPGHSRDVRGTAPALARSPTRSTFSRCCGPPSARSRFSRCLARRGSATAARWCAPLARWWSPRCCSSGCARWACSRLNAGNQVASIETMGDSPVVGLRHVRHGGLRRHGARDARGPHDRRGAHGRWPRARRRHHRLHRVVVHRATRADRQTRKTPRAIPRQRLTLLELERKLDLAPRGPGSARGLSATAARVA